MWEPWMLLDAHTHPWQVEDFREPELTALMNEVDRRRDLGG